MPSWTAKHLLHSLVLILVVGAASRSAADQLDLTSGFDDAWNDVDVVGPVVGSRVLFAAALTTEGRIHPYSVPLTGGPIAYLGPTNPNEIVDTIQRSVRLFGTDRIVFEAVVGTDERQLYSSVVDGTSPAVDLTPDLGGSFRFLDDWTTGPGERVLFTYREGTGNPWKLYANTAGGDDLSAVELAATDNAGTEFALFELNSLGSRVTFLRESQIGCCAQREVFSVPSNGSSAAVRLNDDLPAGGNVDLFEEVSFFGRGLELQSWVVYRADQEVDGQSELYAVKADGSQAPTKISPPLPPGGDVLLVVRSTAADRRVVFSAEPAPFGEVELYSAPMTGGEPLRLTSGAGAEGRTITDLTISPVGPRAVYLDDRSGTTQLYSVPTSGGGATRLNHELSGGSVTDYFPSADGSLVLYEADEDGSGIRRLHLVPVDGGEPIALTTGSLVDAAGCPGVCDWRWGAEEQEILLHVARPTGVVFGAAAPDGSGVTELVDQRVAAFEPTPDGSAVIVRADLEATGKQELFRLGLDGSLLPARLNGLLPPDAEVLDHFLPLPDGSRVLYVSDEPSDELFHLFVADDGRQEIAFDAPSASVAEDDEPIELTVRLSQAAVGPVEVGWSTSGVAASPEDFSIPTSSPLIFPPGVTEGAITVEPVDDGVAEGDETVTISLEDPFNATIGSPAGLVLTIQDGPVTEPIFADGFESGDISAWEG